MSDVKRYDYGYKDDGCGGDRYLGLIEKPDGALVRHSDYAALEAECAQPQARPDRCGCKPDAFQIARHSRRLVEQQRERIAALEAKNAALAGANDNLKITINGLVDELDALAAELDRVSRELSCLQSVIAEPDELNAEPASDYETLRRQYLSLRLLTNSALARNRYLCRRDDRDMRAALSVNAANVSAERDTNAMLTDLLEKAEAERDALQAEADALRAALSAQQSASPEFCCELSYKAAKQKAWNARDLTHCKCDHNEYCEHCWPDDFREGGKWHGKFVARQSARQPELTVWEGPMPESNGKSNFTAVLMRKGANLFDGIAGGMTIARSEYPDRVRYEADCVRWLIGELDNEPCIIDYDADKHSGYVAQQSAHVSVPRELLDAVKELFDAKQAKEDFERENPGNSTKRWDACLYRIEAAEDALRALLNGGEA